MLEFFPALALADKLKTEIRYNVDLPEWNLKFDQNLHETLKSNIDNVVIFRDSDFLSLDHVVKEIIDSGKENVVFEGFFQRLNLYCSVDYYKEYFPVDQNFGIEFEDDELVINIRSGEVLGGVSWYPLVPPTFYEQLIKETKLRPVLLGQLDDSPYLAEILERLPKARLIPSAGPMVDFNRIRQGKKICIAVSTFSWLAAWLSNASEIYYPLLGFLHPHRFKPGVHGLGGIDLAPSTDPRYQFYLLPSIQGEPVHEYLKYVTQFDPVAKRVPPSFVSILKLQQSILPKRTSDIAVDEQWYLKEYQIAAWELSEGWYHDVSHHYAEVGSLRGYQSHKPVYVPRSPNISMGKYATQSSISVWSIEKTVQDDARRALDGDNNKEIAFHTDIEDFPWWMVDLDGSYNIECVNIYNRRNIDASRIRISPFVIEFSMDGEIWVEMIRTPDRYDFGSNSGYNRPLQWTASEPTHARLIRIRVLKREEVLHLAAVEVFGMPSGKLK